MRWIAIWIVAICQIVSIPSVWACITPPAHMYLDHDEAIDHAGWIALVEPVTVDRGENGVFYTFKVIDYLKGNGPATITLPNEDDAPWHDGLGWLRPDTSPEDEAYPVEANYFGHQASSFWLRGGRSTNHPDCRIHPSFLFQGRQYLVFGPTQYNVGYENVTTTDDLWLQYVRDYLDETQTARKPFPIDAATYIDNAEAIVRVTAWWDDGQVFWEQNILKGAERAYTHMLFVSPRATFASIFDPQCPESSDNFPMPRIKRLDFLAVFEFLPKQGTKIDQGIGCTGGEKDGWGVVSGRGLFSVTGSQKFAIEDETVNFNRPLPYVSAQSGKRPVVEETLSLDAIRTLIAGD